MLNPGENLGIWAVVVVGFVAVTGWNISRLAAVRPALDRLVAVLGGAAILAVVIGASLVITEVTECTFAASSLACSRWEILLVGAMDLVAAGALITAWLRTDACRAPYAAVRVRAVPRRRDGAGAPRQQRAVAGVIRA